MNNINFFEFMFSYQKPKSYGIFLGKIITNAQLYQKMWMLNRILTLPTNRLLLE